MRKKTGKKTQIKKSQKERDELFQSLVGIMDRLRGKSGCPWDKEQTRDSIKPFLLEEAYEVLEALERKGPGELKEELGDLLFQILFHAQIAKEKGEFDIYDVLRTNVEKMITRHPHVFSGKDISTSKQVLIHWEEIKKNEAKNNKRKSIMDGIPYKLPALLRAHRYQDRAARVGFDWDSIKDVIKKVDEELRELKKAIKNEDKKYIEEEIGDLLFAIVNLSRFSKINPEEALRKCISKFKKRFEYIEKELNKKKKALRDASLKEMDIIWNRAKKKKIT